MKMNNNDIQKDKKTQYDTFVLHKFGNVTGDIKTITLGFPTRKECKYYAKKKE